MLQDRHWQELYGLSDWQAHCIVVAAINGSVLGYRKKSKEALQQLLEMKDGVAKMTGLAESLANTEEE